MSDTKKPEYNFFQKWIKTDTGLTAGGVLLTILSTALTILLILEFVLDYRSNKLDFYEEKLESLSAAYGYISQPQLMKVDTMAYRGDFDINGGVIRFRGCNWNEEDKVIGFSYKWLNSSERLSLRLKENEIFEFDNDTAYYYVYFNRISEKDTAEIRDRTGKVLLPTDADYENFLQPTQIVPKIEGVAYRLNPLFLPERRSRNH